MITHSVHMIANHISIEGDLPLCFGAGITLRRPTELELPKIRQLLATSGSRFIVCIPYEAMVSEIPEGGFSIDVARDTTEWKYYVLSDDHGGGRVCDLEVPLLLLDPPIEFSVRLLHMHEEGEIPKEPNGHAPPPPHIVERYHQNQAYRPRRTISTSHFLEAQRLLQTLETLNTRHQFIYQAAKLLSELRRLSDYSRFQTIGLFAVLESLVVHKPRLEESLDSISHQLQGKMRLIANRISSVNHLTRTLGDPSEAKLWRLLYTYRSAIAHGQPVEFNGKLASLKSNQEVSEFLWAFTQKAILFALEEPQLIADLKEC